MYGWRRSFPPRDECVAGASQEGTPPWINPHSTILFPAENEQEEDCLRVHGMVTNILDEIEDFNSQEGEKNPNN